MFPKWPPYYGPTSSGPLAYHPAGIEASAFHSVFAIPVRRCLFAVEHIYPESSHVLLPLFLIFRLESKLILGILLFVLIDISGLRVFFFNFKSGTYETKRKPFFLFCFRDNLVLSWLFSLHLSKCSWLLCR